jgi:L-ascorbate metabolism protein UlaG (beta-lactamase superfamily)
VRITKYTHSCVRLAGDGVLVIDPGMFSERSALDGADAVLITHEHPDHLDVDAIREAGVPVWAHPDVLPKLEGITDVTGVEPGDDLTVAGFRVQAYGGDHAIIHPDIPQIANVAYLIDDGDTNVYHPGDSFFVPEDGDVETLFVPLHAPWAKLSESVDFLREVAPRRAYALHDHLVTPVGASIYDGHFDRLGGTAYAHVAPGTTLD